jgi:hypothetical protein
VGIEGDVLLAAADVAAVTASEFHFPFFFFISYGNGNAGVDDGTGVKEQGKPGQPLLVPGKAEAP